MSPRFCRARLPHKLSPQTSLSRARLSLLPAHVKHSKSGGAWVAQSGERPTAAQATISRFGSPSPAVGSPLSAQSPRRSLGLPLSLLSPSLSKINKLKQLKKRIQSQEVKGWRELSLRGEGWNSCHSEHLKSRADSLPVIFVSIILPFKKITVLRIQKLLDAAEK